MMNSVAINAKKWEKPGMSILIKGYDLPRIASNTHIHEYMHARTLTSHNYIHKHRRVHHKGKNKQIIHSTKLKWLLS